MFTPQRSFAPGEGAPGGGGRFSEGALTISGTVASTDGSTMTLTLESGESVTIGLDSTTTYHTADAATADDVVVGDSVAVRVAGAGRGFLGGRPSAPGASAEPSGAPSITADDVTVVR